jgi:hypothetical protein
MRTLIIVCVILVALVLYSGLVLSIGKILAFCGRYDDIRLQNGEGPEDEAQKKDEPTFPAGARRE